MADLKETLSQRERRSRTVAFVVGVAIVLVLIFLIAQANNNDQTATDQQGAGDEVAQVDGEEGVGSEDSQDTTADGGDNTATDDADSQNQNGDQAVTDSENGEQQEQATNEDVVLPATGPEDNAIIGLIAIAVAGMIYAQASSSLKAAELER